MPITPYLKNQAFGPDQIAAMNVAFLKACTRLRLTEKRDLATEEVAAKIIQIAQTGVRNPREICRRALMEFGIDEEAEGSAEPPARPPIRATSSGQRPSK